MALDTKVGKHSTQDDLVELPLSELKHQVIGLWSPHFMRTNDDGFSILDKMACNAPTNPHAEPVKPSSPIGSGRKNSLSSNIMCSTMPPYCQALVMGEKIMRRNEDFVVVHFSGRKQPIEIFNRVVFLNTLADQTPRDTFLAENVILRIDNYRTPYPSYRIA